MKDSALDQWIPDGDTCVFSVIIRRDLDLVGEWNCELVEKEKRWLKEKHWPLEVMQGIPA